MYFPRRVVSSESVKHRIPPPINRLLLPRMPVVWEPPPLTSARGNLQPVDNGSGARGALPLSAQTRLHPLRQTSGLKPHSSPKCIVGSVGRSVLVVPSGETRMSHCPPSAIKRHKYIRCSVLIYRLTHFTVSEVGSTY